MGTTPAPAWPTTLEGHFRPRSSEDGVGGCLSSGNILHATGRPASRVPFLEDGHKSCRCAPRIREKAARTALLGVAAQPCPGPSAVREPKCAARTPPSRLGRTEDSRLMQTPLSVLWPMPSWHGPRAWPLAPREEATVATRPLGPTAGRGPRPSLESWEVAAPQVARPERPAPAGGMRTRIRCVGVLSSQAHWANAGWR